MAARTPKAVSRRRKSEPTASRLATTMINHAGLIPARPGNQPSLPTDRRMPHGRRSARGLRVPVMLQLLALGRQLAAHLGNERLDRLVAPLRIADMVRQP